MAITFILVFITTIDVALRKFTSSSIKGSYEMTEMGMVAIVFLSIAYLHTEKGHVRVDMFIDKFPGRIRHFINGVVYLISSAIILIISCASFSQMAKQYTTAISTAVIHIPLYPFVLIMACGLVLYFIVLLIDAIDSFISAFKFKEQNEAA